MTKVIMNGCNGKMGQTITEICKADADIKIVAGIDLYDGIDNDYPVFSSIDKCDVDADVVIDFSNAKAVDGVLDYCVDKVFRLFYALPVLVMSSLQRLRSATRRWQCSSLQTCHLA